MCVREDRLRPFVVCYSHGLKNNNIVSIVYHGDWCLMPCLSHSLCFRKSHLKPFVCMRTTLLRRRWQSTPWWGCRGNEQVWKLRNKQHRNKGQNLNDTKSSRKNAESSVTPAHLHTPMVSQSQKGQRDERAHSRKKKTKGYMHSSFQCWPDNFQFLLLNLHEYF